MARASRPGSTSCCGGSGSTAPSTGRSTRRGSSRSTPSSPGRRRSTTASAVPSPAPSASGHERPDWELAAGRLAHALAHQPEAFAPKVEFAMDWYYPVLSGALSGEAARRRIDGSWDTFVMEGRGVRCVSTGEWVTAAETAECVLALDALGMDDDGAAAAHLGPGAAQRGRLLLDGHGLSRGGDLPAAGAVVLHGRRHGAGRRRPEPDHPGLGDLPGRGPAQPPRPHRAGPGRPGRAGPAGTRVQPGTV